MFFMALPLARRFEFSFFSVGKNFCHSRILNRKDSELDELSFFFPCG